MVSAIRYDLEESDRVTPKHPMASPRLPEELAVAPLFSLEGETIPRHELPDGELPPDVAY
jgi:hypothetical protein